MADYLSGPTKAAPLVGNDVAVVASETSAVFFRYGCENFQDRASAKVNLQLGTWSSHIYMRDVRTANHDAIQGAHTSLDPTGILGDPNDVGALFSLLVRLKFVLLKTRI